MISVLKKIKEPECGWYDVGLQSYRSGVLHEHPQIDDMVGWFKWFDGFSYGSQDSRLDKYSLRRILGALLYDDINIFLRAWRGERL